MKSKKVKRLKIKPLFFILLTALISMIGLTIAYFTYQESFNNQFKVPAYNLKIDEEFYGEFGTKKVSIVSDDETEVVLRVSYNELWSKESNNELLLLSNKVNGNEVVVKEWTSTWLNDFIDGHDGWYYYKKVLKGKERVQILNRIELDENVIKNSENYDNYKKYDYELSFNYEAVQATQDGVKKSWGIDITITDGEVTWNIQNN